MNLITAKTLLFQWMRKDKKMAFAIIALVLLLTVPQILMWTLPDSVPQADVDRPEVNTQTQRPDVTLPTIESSDAKKTQEPDAPKPQAQSTTDTSRDFAHQTAASMLFMFNQKYNSYVVELCKGVGVSMPRYEAAVQKAYGTSLASAHKILGNNVALLEGFLSFGGREEGLRQMGVELDSTPGYQGSRERVCSGYERDPEKVIAEKHFKKAQPQAFKMLNTPER